MLDASVFSDVNWLSPDLTATFDFSVFDMCASQDPQPSIGQLATSPSQAGDTSSVISLPRSEATRHGAPDAMEPTSPNGSRVKAFYVDSDGSRLTCNERVQGLSTGPIIESSSSISTRNSPSALRFPLLDSTTIAEHNQYPINEANYRLLQDAFTKYCLDGAPLFPPYDASHFISPIHFSFFIRLYFHGFQDIWPILHALTFDAADAHWLLVLAIATIGCHYYPDAECVTPMVEFLRRSVQVEVCDLMSFQNRTNPTASSRDTSRPQSQRK